MGQPKNLNVIVLKYMITYVDMFISAFQQILFKICWLRLLFLAIRFIIPYEYILFIRNIYGEMNITIRISQLQLKIKQLFLLCVQYILCVYVIFLMLPSSKVILQQCLLYSAAN